MSILVISLPCILETSALIPPPLVPVLSNLTLSPILYPLPEETILKLFTFPFVVPSIREIWSIISFDSIIKSLSAYGSDTLYG